MRLVSQVAVGALLIAGRATLVEIVASLVLVGAAAMAKAKSTDPVKVAKAREGLSVTSFAGEVTMRASDHQLQQTMYITKWQKAKKGEYSVENTGYTFVPIKQMDPYVSSTPTSCQMKRPAG